MRGKNLRFFSLVNGICDFFWSASELEAFYFTYFGGKGKEIALIMKKPNEVKIIEKHWNENCNQRFFKSWIEFLMYKSATQQKLSSTSNAG